ncbi:hypothetical protein [Kitasatospora sp. NPDC091207]|uniref:hypothetical protein n=1 Tax=Kitasatospora sp. NPDC091207 TaxID=3364083 RepID=UPI00380AD368
MTQDQRRRALPVCASPVRAARVRQGVRAHVIHHFGAESDAAALAAALDSASPVH